MKPSQILLSRNVWGLSYPIICSQGELQGVLHQAKIVCFFNRQQRTNINMIAKNFSAELVHESRVFDFKAFGLRLLAPGLILLSINAGGFSYPIICSQGELKGDPS